MVMGTRGWDAFDVLKAMLASLEQHRIPAGAPIFHSAIYRLAQKEEFNKLLGQYVFERRSYFPFSRELQTDLVNLEMSGHLSTPNPNLEQYELKPKLRTTFEKYTKSLFNVDEIATINRMAQDFLETVTHPQAA